MRDGERRLLGDVHLLLEELLLLALLFCDNMQDFLKKIHLMLS